MELKGRLAMIASLVPECGSICDVGTDHAYIPVFLVKSGVCERAQAMDINEGPLIAANENIRYFGLTERIETRLGNGLEPLKHEEVDVIVIAGMGGILITEILQNSIEKAKASSALILQPMNAVEILRKWLYENGFDIIDEMLANEESKIYNAIKVKWTGKTCSTEVIDYYIGRKLIEKGGSLFKTYMIRRLNQSNKVIDGLKKSKNTDEAYLRLYGYLNENYLRILNSLKGD